jgi:aerobic-type carbon monoxide dehydrogenase small subunit (CoxS/CutS family)
LQLVVDGQQVEVPDDGAPLSEVLRDRLGLRSVKDGCSPQGQCGCCTVLVDGSPRVSCVTPARRVRGREITTLDGLPEAERQQWGEAFCATGASQCGFCTPGIIVRLSGLQAKGALADDRDAVNRALAAHLCRCTGWQTIHEAWSVVAGGGPAGAPEHMSGDGRDLDAAARRAELEGHVPQRVSPEVALGAGGFADDTAPSGALVAVTALDGSWAVGETLTEARAAAAKVQGRRTTVDPEPPLELPPGEWAVTLQTSWVEPAYLETDASWCEPGGEPAGPLANGGAFGGKATSPVGETARRLADEHGRAVRVLWSREDSVRLGPKRPPIAAGVRADGTGVVRVVRTPGIAEAIAAVAPRLTVEEVDVPGPPTSSALRAAGWAEAAGLLAAVAGGSGDGPTEIRSPDGAVASAAVVDGAIQVRVACGDPLDEVVLRSYCIGAAHMALGWVTSEGLAVDGEGEVHDLTVRSFGVLRAADTPAIEVVIDAPAGEPGEPVNGSDAVFAAVAAEVWRHQGTPTSWPTGQVL